MIDIPTKYDPKITEDKWYKYWEDNGFFKAKADPDKKPYTIVIPPPNITGILHMGHALNNSIQDILIRYKRMRGYEVLWLPGTDHAGIATQNVVEKQLAKENLKRQDVGRDEFLKRVWKWRDEYGNAIITQLKKLGCSCDWSRTRFTMDEGLSDAVLEVFVKLYEKGLIYKGDYIINWCPRCQTALSDEEAEHRDIDGMLYHIKYAVSGSDDHVVVATTRPETMLGDVAVAFNPKDKRYKHLKGKKLILPVLNRELEAIFDRLVDPKFGTGALKVTPAHDPIDFQLGLTHNLKPINVMNPNATMNKYASQAYDGMDRLECRKALLEELKERNLLVKTEPHRHAVAHCYRCHTMVEPRLSKQWFVKMKPLAKRGIQAARKKKIKFYPSRWTKVYLNWMDNIKDWCISRQIWWGHRIPVYYCKDCQAAAQSSKAKSSKSKKDPGIIVSKIRPDKCPDCGSTKLEQDPDVLDTWFSSWLWPFSTLGWPAKTKDLDYFYPTNTLVTAPEIIFFWVARMVMAGLEFMDDIPFSNIYIHGTVRDATGTKMSKSLGNTIDPLSIINEFGADALRFSIISITAVGQDVFLSREKFQSGRNFANKIWNASRLTMLNLDKDELGGGLSELPGKEKLDLKERWILSRFYQTVKKVSGSLDNHKINDAAKSIYEFFWHEFCDWYLELAKSSFSERNTQLVLYNVLEQSLRMLHPFMPFITEEIWHALPHEGESIMVSAWPELRKKLIDADAEADMDIVISVISALRNMRSSWGIEAQRAITAYLKSANDTVRQTLSKSSEYIKRLGRVEELIIEKDIKKPESSATSVCGEIEVFVPLKGVIDYDKEKARLTKKREELEVRFNQLSGKLKNKEFLNNAPADVVAKFKSSHQELKAQIDKIKTNLQSLG